MNYLFIYYTGTYNTRFLTERIKEKLIENGDTCKTVEIAKDTQVIDVKKYDIIGLGFPIYGFNSPLPFNKYIAKLNFCKGQRFFIYKNSGETLAMNNSASRIPLKIMRKNECEFLGEYHFLMPYNIHFPFERELMLNLFAEDKKLLEIMKYNLKHGIVKYIKSTFLLDAGAFAVSIQKLGGNFNSFFYKVDNSKCIKCRLCVDNCPEKNISLKSGKIIFGHNCDMCMRCSFFCPEKAIKIGMLENWKISSYYNLEELWESAEISKKYELDKNTQFYKSYIHTFNSIDSEYIKLKNTQNKTAY